MEKLCMVCNKPYTAERTTKIYCSTKCKAKLHRQAKTAGVIETVPALDTTSSVVPVVEVGAVEQDWIPSRRESLLNNVVQKLYNALLDVDRLANQGVALERLLEVTKKARKTAALEDAMWEVEAFDIEQRIYDPTGFEQRTGLKLSEKRATR